MVTSANLNFTEIGVQTLLKVSDAEWKGMITTGLCLGLNLPEICLVRDFQIDARVSRFSLTSLKYGTVLDLPIIQPLKQYLEPLLGLRRAEEPIFKHASELFTADPCAIKDLRLEFRKLQLRAQLLLKPAEPRHDADEAVKSGPRSFGALRQTLRTLLQHMPADACTLLGHRSDLLALCSAPPRPRHPLESPWLVEQLSRFLSVR